MVGWHDWLDGREFEQLWEMVKDREVWHAAVHRFSKSQTRLSNWPTTNPSKSPGPQKNTKGLPHCMANHWQSWRPLSRLAASVTGESLERWRRPRNWGLGWAHALPALIPQRSPAGMTNSWIQSRGCHLETCFLGWSGHSPFVNVRSGNYFPGHLVSSVAQSCPTLCDPMNSSTPGLPVHH